MLGFIRRLGSTDTEGGEVPARAARRGGVPGDPSVHAHWSQPEARQTKGVISISDTRTAARLRFMGLKPSEVGTVAEWWPVLQPNMDRLVDRFYDHIESEPDAWQVVLTNTTVDRQRPRLTSYIRTGTRRHRRGVGAVQRLFLTAVSGGHGHVYGGVYRVPPGASC